LTRKGYRWLIERHVRQTLGRVRLEKLTPTMTRRLLETETDSGLATGSVRHIHGLIRNAPADAEREELVHRNVAKPVRSLALWRPRRRPEAPCHPSARWCLCRSDVVGPVGLEPTTSGLKVRCSTN
jgi:hypothetical protein